LLSKNKKCILALKAELQLSVRRL